MYAITPMAIHVRAKLTSETTAGVYGCVRPRSEMYGPNASLRVSYVLDGSVRKSGDTLRVAARLVRADDGYVVWSETYDRPVDDKLMVQDDIAGEVTSALRTSID